MNFASNRKTRENPIKILEPKNLKTLINKKKDGHDYLKWNQPKLVEEIKSQEFPNP